MTPAPINKTALSYWFPLIEAAGLPVPKTTIIPMTDGAYEFLYSGFDGEEGGDIAAFRDFVDRLNAASKDFTFPLFLRTDFTSAKHSWDKTCYVENEAALIPHFQYLAERSDLMNMFGGLDYNTWVLREMLPTIPLATCPAYGNMPVNREFRYFVSDGEIVCAHPYWPEQALIEGGVETDLELMTELGFLPDMSELDDLAKRAAVAVGGAWSIDILETKRGWFVTDMAEAEKSFHWPECEINK
jgi:hypothetical protein